MTSKNSPTRQTQSHVAKDASRRIVTLNAADYGVEVSKAFEVDNGKQLSIERTVQYFVPPKNFPNLLTGKNHILLGSRGSGKTTWVRMLAHDHVLLAAQQGGERFKYAQEALAKNIIGIYVPTNIGLVGSLKNKPWQGEEEAEEFFQWRLNIHSAAALVPIIRSCIQHYIKGQLKQREAELIVCESLSRTWSRGTSQITTLQSLRLLLSDIETKRIDAIARSRAKRLSTEDINDYFDTELFHPIKHAIQVLTHALQLPVGALWMICIDEAEYLMKSHHRILNTHLRTAADNLVFKIATMPFAHHTLDTNAGDPVRDGHDFEYVYVDQMPIDSRGAQDDSEFLSFARNVFARRLEKSSELLRSLTLRQLLGPSPLIDEKTVESKSDEDQFMNLLEKYANEPTRQRARRLLETDRKRFRSEILRKMHGALILRDAITTGIGNSKLRVYAGEAMAVRCADGNARRLVRLLNALAKRLVGPDGSPLVKTWPLDAGIQNDVLVAIGRDTLSRIQSEPPNGMRTYKYLQTIGQYMSRSFSSRRLGSDFVTSITIEPQDGGDLQEFIKQAVQLSLLTPDRKNLHNGSNAPCEGTFHLAFLFAPVFGLLPRRNKAQRLPKILATANLRSDIPSVQTMLDV